MYNSFKYLTHHFSGTQRDRSSSEQLFTTQIHLPASQPASQTICRKYTRVYKNFVWLPGVFDFRFYSPLLVLLTLWPVFLLLLPVFV